eukprot:NODE_1613_length_811_cov_226.534121_g1348_i0.p2 GENE.NODE_1613_length_811_cov_226.534121_g1348_i0~~NODE_1613_length_811_cov_226.534121_g1348_i0.p2  ORF type:complete len:219 (-),score=45.68 NODE_1613_length_811_cov_226.534121_g1348_i0:155-787(-)
MGVLQEAVQPDCTDPELLWRFARAHYQMGVNAKSKDEQQKYFVAGLQYAERAREYGDTIGPCHKWWAIMVKKVGDFGGTKEKIQNAFKIKEAALRAVELTPTDGTSHHLLGAWFYNVANVGWIERKVATALFASPPEGTYEEAIPYLERAHELLPDFHDNALMLGDAYKALSQPQKAKEWYLKLAAMPTRTEEETRLVNEGKSRAAAIKG